MTIKNGRQPTRRTTASSTCHLGEDFEIVPDHHDATKGRPAIKGVRVSQYDEAGEFVGLGWIKRLYEQRAQEPRRVSIPGKRGDIWVTVRTPNQGELVFARWIGEDGKARSGWGYWFADEIVGDEHEVMVTLVSRKDSRVCVVRREADIVVVGVRE